MVAKLALLTYIFIILMFLFLSWNIFELDMSVCLLLEMAFLFLHSFLSWNLFCGGFGV